MAFQSIGLGSTADDGTGDTIRVGGDKINDNFTEIYTLLGTGTALTSGLSATSSVVTLAGPSITGVASFADGSASAPSITNTGDTNTGVFFSAADEVAITTGGTQRFKVTASGIEIADGGNIGSASDTDAMSISSGGVVAFSASLQVKNGATSAGFIEFFEDSDNGTNKATLIGPASTADVTLTLPAVTDTVAVVGDVIALGIALG
jgi:hypothetical protein|tara:strand:+ start:163 stop:780 length:618 start_codon:yes stop_codon:yes gene_type:complete